MKKKVVIAVTLFLVIFCIFGLPFTSWWFFGADDFHALYLGYQTKTVKQLLYHFIDGNIAQGAGPSNYAQPTTHPTFFSVYYRPLYLVYLTLQYWFFGTNAYYYHLCNVFFHALNTALIFMIFCWFSPFVPALFAALFFAVHPQIGYRFGAIVNLHYYVNVTLLIGVTIFYKKWLDTKKWWTYLGACLLFALSLLTRESSIVFPAVLFLGTWVYKKNKTHCIKSVCGFILIASLFLVWRLHLYPFGNVPTSPSCSLISKLPELKVFLYDFFTLSWLPWGKPLIRLGLLIGCMTGFFALFLRCTKKRETNLLFGAGSIMLWPALMGPYSPRYFYEAWPFFLAGFLMCFTYQEPVLNSKFKQTELIFFSLLICFYSAFCWDSFQRRAIKHQQLSTAVHQLIQNSRVHNRALCFLCQPLDGMGEQNPDIFKILLNQPDKIIYFDSSTAITQADKNLIEPVWWGNRVSMYHEKNYFLITPLQDGFRITSLDPNKVFFNLSLNGYSLGKKIIHQMNNNTVIDFSLIIDQEYLDQKPLFIFWDFERKAFIIHEHF